MIGQSHFVDISCIMLWEFGENPIAACLSINFTISTSTSGHRCYRCLETKFRKLQVLEILCYFKWTDNSVSNVDKLQTMTRVKNITLNRIIQISTVVG